MDDMAFSNGRTNGTPPAPPPTTTDDKITPWAAAGFKTREEFRKAKKTSATTPPKLAIVPKPTEQPAKTAKPAKPSAIAKPIATRTEAEKKAAHDRVLSFKRALAKREEPSEKERRVLDAFGAKGSTKTISELGAKAFTNKSTKIQNSWSRNALRWIVATKQAKKVGRGTYERL